MLTNIEVQEQKERFTAFINSVNLAKIGKTWFSLPSSEKNGRYTQLCYISKVLALAKVSAACYMPNTNSFYSEILINKALNAFIDSVKN